MDAEPYERIQKLLAVLPGAPSLSVYVNASIYRLAEVIPPLVRRAMEGDGQAALELMDYFYIPPNKTLDELSASEPKVPKANEVKVPEAKVPKAKNDK